MAMPEAPVSFGSVWLLGVALGLTACTVTCLPFMGSWTLGRNGNMRLVIQDTIAFLLGRFVAYVSLGALAGALGAWLVLQLSSGIGNAVIGAASLVAATSLLWPAGRRAKTACRQASGWSSGSPFLIGTSLTLIPCAPLTTLLATCASGNSTFDGALYGAAFGAGTLITPMLVLIPACGRFGRLLKEEREWLAPWIRTLAALVLLALAITRLALFDAELAIALPCLCGLIILWARLRAHDAARQQKTIPLQIVR